VETILKHNKIMAMTTSGDEACPYYIYVPKTISERPTILVSVHGITRNAIEHSTRFVEHFDLSDTVLVVPLFTKERFKHFQILREDAAGLRPSDALNLILEDIETKYGFETKKITLNGYSGGGQFAHRYAMLYPERIQKLILMAPDWYTFPNAEMAYPEGLATSGEFENLQLYPKGLLSFPIEVLVGERDNRRDKKLNCNSTIDKNQGRNRLKRSQNWIRAIIELAILRDIKPNIKMTIIPGAHHDFKANFRRANYVQCVREAVFGIE